MLLSILNEGAILLLSILNEENILRFKRGGNFVVVPLPPACLLALASLHTAHHRGLLTPVSR